MNDFLTDWIYEVDFINTDEITFINVGTYAKEAELAQRLQGIDQNLYTFEKKEQFAQWMNDQSFSEVYVFEDGEIFDDIFRSEVIE